MSEWISVNDRLPEEDGRYLCLTWLNYSGNRIPWYRIVSFVANAETDEELAVNGIKGPTWCSYNSEWGLCCADNITHWMPLSEPPKEE